MQYKFILWATEGRGGQCYIGYSSRDWADTKASIDEAVANAVQCYAEEGPLLDGTLPVWAEQVELAEEADGSPLAEGQEVPLPIDRLLGAFTRYLSRRQSAEYAALLASDTKLDQQAIKMGIDPLDNTLFALGAELQEAEDALNAVSSGTWEASDVGRALSLLASATRLATLLIDAEHNGHLWLMAPESTP